MDNVKNESSQQYKVEADATIKRARQLLRQRAERVTAAISDPASAKEVLEDWVTGLEREEFIVMLLDTAHRGIHIETLFSGTINACPVYPREVLKLALNHNAAAVILAHNHPSGNLEPSMADRQVTERIKKALDMIDMSLLDHFVIDPHGVNETVSFAERGLL